MEISNTQSEGAVGPTHQHRTSRPRRESSPESPHCPRALGSPYRLMRVSEKRLQREKWERPMNRYQHSEMGWEFCYSAKQSVDRMVNIEDTYVYICTDLGITQCIHVSKNHLVPRKNVQLLYVKLFLIYKTGMANHSWQASVP